MAFLFYLLNHLELSSLIAFHSKPNLPPAGSAAEVNESLGTSLEWVW